MRTTLITGADGYLGNALATALAGSSSDQLILTVRATDAAEFAAKKQRFTPHVAERARFVAVDLRDSDPFGAIDPGGVHRIVHTAALTSFTVDREAAREVNLEGTIRVRDFAAACPDLERFVALSTLYVAGVSSGDIREQHREVDSFVNHYEWSKWSAEQALLEPGSPPVVIARIPTVIADDDSGFVSQHNAFHNTLKLYYYGLLSLLPGDENTVLHLGTADFTVRALTQLLEPGTPAGIYHVTPDPAKSPTLGAAVRAAFEEFGADEAFRRRRLLLPVVCDRESFEDLLDAATIVRRSALGDALASIAPFAEQLYIPKIFHNDELRAVWPEFQAPDTGELIRATCRHLVDSRWGRGSRRIDVSAQQ